MKGVDLSTVDNRGEVEKMLTDFIPELRIRQFIMKNLHRKDKNEFEWRIYIDGIDNNLDQMFDAIDTITKFEKPNFVYKRWSI